MDRLDLLRLCIAAWMLWAIYWIIAAFTVNRTKSSEGLLLRLGHILPLLIGFILIFHGGHPWIFGHILQSRIFQFSGAAITVLGLLFSLWSRIHLGRYWSGIITLKEGHKLIRTGPYRFVRHPLYSGFLAAVFGTSLVAGTGDALIGFAIIFVAYLVKMSREETVLTNEFGDDYRTFKRERSAIIPFIY